MKAGTNEKFYFEYSIRGIGEGTQGPAENSVTFAEIVAERGRGRGGLGQFEQCPMEN